ncbi:hypothetical protein EI94DRAFT_1704419 [Lactarius quietus]|nr:hypothetical protein EI94DRAFT_1704419 [Lactarius quietus]
MLEYTKDRDGGAIELPRFSGESLRERDIKSSYLRHARKRSHRCGGEGGQKPAKDADTAKPDCTITRHDRATQAPVTPFQQRTHELRAMKPRSEPRGPYDYCVHEHGHQYELDVGGTRYDNTGRRVCRGSVLRAAAGSSAYGALTRVHTRDPKKTMPNTIGAHNMGTTTTLATNTATTKRGIIRRHRNLRTMTRNMLMHANHLLYVPPSPPLDLIIAQRQAPLQGPPGVLQPGPHAARMDAPCVVSVVDTGQLVCVPLAQHPCSGFRFFDTLLDEAAIDLERLELPAAYAKVEDGEEKLARKGLQRLRAQDAGQAKRGAE